MSSTSNADENAEAEEKVFVITTKPENSLSISTICQLPTNSIVYVLCPPSASSASIEEQESVVKKALDKCGYCEAKTKDLIRVRRFDPFFDNVKTSAKQIASELEHCKGRIYGILFNPYGATGSSSSSVSEEENGVPSPQSGLLALAEYKLISSAILLDQILPFLAPNARVIFSGSESARGLPKMGFPVPDLGTTETSLTAFLTGQAYLNNSKNRDNESNKDSTTTPPSSYKWEIAYADISAIGVLYMKAMARRHPNVYFATVSPGMTQESLNAYHVSINPSLGLKLQMFAFRYIVFGLLKHWEIAKDVQQAGALFVKALTGHETGKGDYAYDYPSGTFVGAKGGTGGPLCDQTELKGGKVFLEEEMQEIAYRIVTKYIDNK